MNKLLVGIFVVIIAFIVNYFFFTHMAESIDVTPIHHSNNESHVAIFPNSNPIASPLNKPSSRAQADMIFVTDKNVPVLSTQLNEFDQGKKKHSNEQSSGNEDKFTLDEVLLNIPQDYHSIFSWNMGQNDKFIQEYGKLQAAQQIEAYQHEVEKQITSFIFQHEQGSYIQIERLNCTQNFCELFGLTQMSNSWNDIERDMSNAPWWPFSSSTSQSGVSEKGQMVFIALFYK